MRNRAGTTQEQPAAQGLGKARACLPLLLAAWLLLAAPAPAEAYLGPGAGFLFSASFLLIFSTISAALVSLLAWPVRMFWRFMRRRRRVDA